jgi:hypothetical protein
MELAKGLQWAACRHFPTLTQIIPHMEYKAITRAGDRRVPG